jgi:hypothetical protein
VVLTSGRAMVAGLGVPRSSGRPDSVMRVWASAARIGHLQVGVNRADPPWRGSHLSSLCVAQITEELSVGSVLNRMDAGDVEPDHRL